MKRLTTRQRLERLVMRVAYPPLDGMGAVVTVGTARHLLELEHRRLRAKVRRLKDYAEPFDMKRRAFYLDVIDDVLKAMR